VIHRQIEYDQLMLKDMLEARLDPSIKATAR